MHPNSELMFRAYAAQYVKAHHRVLEIGPDKFPSTYHECCNRVGSQWDYLDLYEHPEVNYRASDPYNYPIESESYDVVISANVMEHVPKIWVWAREIMRITKKDGLIITIVPVSWPYHPPDCWRIYPDGLRALLEDIGLTIEFVTWGSLENPEMGEGGSEEMVGAEGSSKSIPGRSTHFQPEPYRSLAAQLARLGPFPIERAYDTLCVARKPAEIRRATGLLHLRQRLTDELVRRLSG